MRTTPSTAFQLPLPEHLDSARIIDLIDPAKDVDGVHPFNIGRLALRRPALRSCTPKGIMHLLEHTGAPIRGLDATVIGASNHVGRPMGLELLLAGCTVTTAHKFSRDSRAAAASADIVIAAVGKAGLVRGDWNKPGARQAARGRGVRGGGRARRVDHSCPRRGGAHDPGGHAAEHADGGRRSRLVRRG